MKRFCSFGSLGVAALVGAVVLGTPTSAQATFSVKITTTAGTQTITDGGAGDLDATVNNSITISYNDAAYHLIGVISFTNSPGTASKAILDVSYNISTVNGGTGGAASIVASSTGFTAPSANPLTLNSSINGNGSGTGTLSLTQLVNTSDTLFPATGTGPGTQGPFNVSSGYGSSASVQFNKAAGAYSLTETLAFNLGTNSNTSGDAQSIVTPSPAPASLMLAFSALPALGVGRLLRRRRA